jgi:hypothetical protein
MGSRVGRTVLSLVSLYSYEYCPLPASLETRNSHSPHNLAKDRVRGFVTAQLEAASGRLLVKGRPMPDALPSLAQEAPAKRNMYLYPETASKRANNIGMRVAACRRSTCARRSCVATNPRQTQDVPICIRTLRWKLATSPLYYVPPGGSLPTGGSIPQKPSDRGNCDGAADTLDGVLGIDRRWWSW